MDEPLLGYEEIVSPRRDAPLLILLHGRGADEHDLLPIVDYVARGWHALSVRAPYEFSMGGYAWYDFTWGAEPDPEGLRKSLRDLERFVADASEENPESPIVFLGFSQGALMALCVATQRPSRLAGVAALSGHLPLEPLLPAPASNLKGLPIFQSHATNDPVLPYALAVSTRERLIKAGADLTWIEHEGGHSIPLSAMDRLGTWLTRVAYR